MSLTLCMIVRDVAPYVGKALDSVIDHVDKVVIVDTGSTDDTLNVIRNQCRKDALEIVHFNSETNPEAFLRDVPETFANLEGSDVLSEFSGKTILADFGKARQAGWDRATTDFIMWIDSDDVVEGAEKIPEIIAAMEERKLDTALMEYDYEVTSEGHVTCRLLRTRIARRSGPARWQQPIHEVLTPLGASEVFRQVRVVHRAAQLSDKVSPATRPPMRNLKVLINECARLTRDGEPIHPRLWFYLGNETRPHDHDRAIAYLGRYVKESDWDEEKALAHVYIGQLLESHGKLIEARAHYASASVIFPDKPETHFSLARIAHYLQDHEACVLHHRAGEIACWRKRDTLHYNPYDRTLYPAICDAPSFIETGDYKKALKLAEDALAIQPESTHLHAIKAVAKAKISERWRPRDIAIWTGNALEVWNPNIIDADGIGGSETAAANIARELTKLGHRVTVYSNCGDGAGTYDGVNYVHFEDVIEKMRIDCDIFISSRNVQIFDLDIRAAKKLLWFHDTEVGSAVVPQVAGNLMKADFLLTLSKWHHDLIHKTYPFIHPSKILVTRNGIDVRKFADEPVKVGNRLIYSSSPDRGLAILLEVFPKVREQIPDAELHVFYGFNNFERLVEKLASEDERQKGRQEIARLKAALADIEGITFHGRVGQARLARAMLEAKVWSYLTWFSETSCISAMEAQAAGCIPVTTELAALKETVHQGFLLKPPCTSDKYKETAVKRIVWCLQNEEKRADLARRARKEALKLHAWSSVAEEWDDMFARIMESRAVLK